MGKSKIEWTGRVWNPVIGCSKVSPGCDHCYAERMAHRQAHMEIKRGGPERYGKTIKSNGKWSGKTVFVESAIDKPLHWKKPRMVFANSMGDLFHPSVLFEWIDRVMAVIWECR